MKKRILTCLFVTVNIAMSLCQSFDKDQLVGFSSSVKTRLYDFYLKSPIDKEKQLKLALIFNEEDSLLQDGVEKLKSIEELDGIRNNALMKAKGVVSESEYDKYYLKTLESATYVQAHAQAKCLSNYFKLDSAARMRLVDVEYRKMIRQNVYLLKNLHGVKDVSVIDSVCVKYNEELFPYIVSQRQNMFLESKLKEIESVKPLGDKRELVKSKYLELCSKNNDHLYDPAFVNALFSVANDTAYALYYWKDQINKIAVYNSEIILKDIIREKPMNRYAQVQIKKQLFEREKELEILNRTYRTLTPQKKILQDSIINLYGLKVTNIKYEEGVDVPNSQFFVAVKNKRTIGLTKIQVDSLVHKGLMLERLYAEALTPKGKAVDVKQYEKENISSILTEDQYSQYLRIKNWQLANYYAKNDWADVLKFGLKQSSDSVKVYDEMVEYQLSRCIATDRYFDDPEKRRANHNAIDSTMPPVLVSLQAARRWQSKSGKKKGDSLNKGNYQW